MTKKIPPRWVLASIISRTIFIGLITVLCAYTTDAGEQENGRLFNHRIEIGGTPFTVAIADTPREQSRGLSGWPGLKDGEGMLFIFRKPAKYEIWMKDMLFAIDILWISEQRRITDIEEKVTPDTYPELMRPKHPAKFVLEVKAGSVTKLGLRIGDVLDY